MRTAAIALLLLGSACHDHGDHDHGDDDAHLYCQGDEDPLSAGMVGAGTNGDLQLRIDKYTPDPLIVGDNSFTVTVVDDAGDPVDGATIDMAETWQRVHDHGTPIEPVITAGEDPGAFTVAQMNVIHTGSWLFRFAPTDGNGTADFVEFNFGIECPPDPDA